MVAALLCVMNCSIDDAANGASHNQDPSANCKNRKDLAGECYKVRGRMRAYGAYPPCRIWPVGTARLLGISDPNSLPSNVACGEGFEVYADYMVCPLTGARPSGMQMVCVASAGNLRASEVKQEAAH
jgi:hypothetical protein